MNTWKIILATVVIFVAGVISGGLLVSYCDRVASPALRRLSAADNPLADSRRIPVEFAPFPTVRQNRSPLLRKDFLNQLNKELSLTPEQRERIEKLISQGQERTRDVWRAEMMVIRQKIRAELTPEQQTRFQALLKQRPAERRRLAAPDRATTNSIEPAISSNSAVSAEPYP